MKILFCIIFITSTLFAQSIELGFRSESTWFKTTLNTTDFIPLYHFFLTAGIVEQENILIVKDFTEELRLGRILAPGILKGNDLSFELKSHLITKLIYVAAGLDFHFNEGDNHSPDMIYAKNIYLLNFGIGVSIDKYLFIEVSKYIPISNPSIGEHDYIDLNNHFIRDLTKLNSLIAIDFGIAIDLSHVIK